MSKPYDPYVNSSTSADEEKRREELMSGHNGIPDQYAYARGKGEAENTPPAAPDAQENARTGNS